MNILKSLALFLSVGVATLPGVALAEVIDCTMDPGFNRWYIAPVIRVDIGEGGAVKVSDDLIRSTDRKAVFGEVAKDTEKQLVIAWQLRDVPLDPEADGRSQKTLVLSRLVIKRSNGVARLTTDVRNSEHSPYAIGTCSFRK